MFGYRYEECVAYRFVLGTTPNHVSIPPIQNNAMIKVDMHAEISPRPYWPEKIGSSQSKKGGGSTQAVSRDRFTELEGGGWVCIVRG